MISPDDVKRREKEFSDTAFDTFMRSPTIRLLISLLPPSENNETLPVLLRAAFEAGFAAGAGSVSLMLMESFLKKEERRQ